MNNKQLFQINLLKLFFLLSFIFLSSCQTNPATGEEEFLLMSEKEEWTIGAREHKKIIQEFNNKKSKVSSIQVFDSIGVKEVESAEAGEIVIISGALVH